MRQFLFLLFPLVFALQSAQADDDRTSWRPNDYWEATQLNFQNLIHGIYNAQSCKASVRSLLGCVAGVNKMRQLQSPGTQVLVKFKLGGAGDFYEVDHSELNPDEYIAEYQKYMRLLEKDLEQLGEAMRLMPFSIEDKVSEFEQKYVTATNDSMSAGILFNEYLKIAKDPHTYIVPRALIEDDSASIKPVKGIGIEMLPFNDLGVDSFIIKKVVEGSPANASGIQAGDIILKANAKTGKNGIMEAIRGNEVIQFTMLRGGEEVEINLTKAVFSTRQLEAYVFQQNGKNYGYFELKSFMDQNACRNIMQTGLRMLQYNVEGIILDLRNNGGGRVDLAQCIMALYLEPGSRVWGERRVDSNELTTYPVRTGINIFSDLHTVTLINSYSASASEATAMYLRDYRKTFTIGERSYGKGSMQGLTSMPENPRLLNGRTQALYYGPKGISPQVRGVEPDIEIYASMEQTEPTPAKREEDTYTFPLRDKSVDPRDYMEPQRLDEIETVKDCALREGKRQSDYDKLDIVGKAIFDNQLQAAFDVIDCANKYVPIHKETNLRRVDHWDYMDFR